MPENLSLPDPRRRGFRARSPVDEVVAWIDRRVETLGPQDLSLGDAAGRVLAAGIRAAISVAASRSAASGRGTRSAV